MKKNILIFSFLVIVLNTFSQNLKESEKVVLYTFEEATGTFESINNTGTSIVPADWDDGCSSPVNIGFDFIYNDVVFSQFTVNTNGTVNLGTSTVSTATNNLASTTFYNLLSPLWDDLLFRNPGATEGLFYLLEGTAGNQILTIEFLNVGRYMNIAEGTSVGTVSFQVKLFEADNHIEFVYGDLSGVSDWSVNSTTSIGINGQTEGSTVFLSVTPNSISGATVSYTTVNNSILTSDLAEIAIGTTYKFTPPALSNNFDIRVESINSPVNGFLYENEIVGITLLNIGIDINENLVLEYEFIDLNTSTVVASYSEDYNTYGVYPLLSGNFYDFEFTQLVDLSENSIYQLTVNAILTDDVNLENNDTIIEVEGVIIDNIIFSNVQLITHPGAGYDNADVSAVQQDLGLGAWGDNASSLLGYRNADDFTVPMGEEWTITGFGFYNFQTGSTVETTFNQSDFKIWDNTPDIGTILYDFTENNMLTGSQWTQIYRALSSDLLNNERPIMHNICYFDDTDIITLTAGTYWIDYSCEGDQILFTGQPYVTILGETITGNGMHFGIFGWVPLTDYDVENTQGMPFEVFGTVEIIETINETSDIEIYPNPCNRYLTINTNYTDYQINIYNLTGEKIYSEKNITNDKIINTENFNTGIYIIEILSSENKIVKKIIIQ